MRCFSVSDDAIIDGFTITRGNGSFNKGKDGGGIFIESSSPRVSNVVFSHNNSPNFGGAIYNNTSGQAYSILKSLSSPDTRPKDLAWDGKFLWNVDGSTNSIMKIDISSG